MAQKIVLIVTILVAVFLFFFKLESIPASVYSDESTVGYNAYSILKTGKDEYGQPFPVAFRFFGAYTPPAYVYATIPFIYYFGLNAFSIRILSGLSTLMLIFVILQFAKSLKLTQSWYFPSLAALVFATTPWVIFNSRLGYEVTFGYCLYYIGVYLLWKSLLKKEINFWGLFYLALSTYIAHTERYLVPLFLVCFFICFKKELIVKKNHYRLILSGILLFLLQIPNLYLLFKPAFWVKNVAFGSSNVLLGLKDFCNQLIVYFSPQTYFGTLNADINLQHFIPEISLFYSWQIVFFIVGLLYLLVSPKTQSKKIIFILLLTAPLPGAFSGHFMSIQRVLPIIIPLVLIIAYGISTTFTTLLNSRYYILPLVLVFAFSLLLFCRSYFILLPGLRADWWVYGAEDIALFINSHHGEEIVVDNSRDQSLYSPLLFYTKFSPLEFQKQFKSTVLPNYYQNPQYNPVVSFGKTTTRPIQWEKDTVENKYLIGDSLAISASQATEHFLDKVEIISDRKGKILFEIYKTNPALKLEDNKKKLLKGSIIK